MEGLSYLCNHCWDFSRVGLGKAETLTTWKHLRRENQKLNGLEATQALLSQTVGLLPAAQVGVPTEAKVPNQE